MKLKNLIKEEGDLIGWEEENLRVGPKAAAAKTSILRLIPRILPSEEVGSGDGPDLYRLVLRHNDFGVHNISTLVDVGGQVHITSVFDWETGNILPIILCDFSFPAVYGDLKEKEFSERYFEVSTLRDVFSQAPLLKPPPPPKLSKRSLPDQRIRTNMHHSFSSLSPCLEISSKLAALL